MLPLSVVLRRFVAVLPWVALAISVGCQGPDEFYRLKSDDQPGTAGSSSPGAGGTTGAAGDASGRGGTGGGPTGTGGVGMKGGTGGSSGGATGNAGASGTAGSVGGSSGGGAGTGGSVGGSTGTGGRGGTTGGRGGATAGTTGTGGAAGAAGSAGGRGGTTGTGGGSAGASGTSGGRGGTTGGRGGGTAGTTGAGGAGGSGPNRLQVQAYCQSANDAQNIRVTFRIVNPDSVAKLYSDIKVRYYFTPTAQVVPSAVTDFVQTQALRGMLTFTATTEYAEVGFMTGTGTLAAFDTITGSDQIQLRIYNFSTPTWNGDFTDDWSNVACVGGPSQTYVDRPKMTGLLPGAARLGHGAYGGAHDEGRAARPPSPSIAFGLGSRRRRDAGFSLRPRMAMTYRLFAPVGRFVVASTFLTACAASPPPPAPGAPAAPAAAAAPPASAAPPVPAVVSAAADWNAPPTNGSPGVDVPKLSGNELLENTDFAGSEYVPWTTSFTAPGAGDGVREGRSVLHRRHQQGQ